MILVITGENEVPTAVLVRSYVRSYQTEPPPPEGGYLEVERFRDNTLSDFEVVSYPAWLKQDLKETFSLAISRCTSWQAVHRTMSATFGASVMTAQQASAHNQRNLVLSLRDSIAKHSELLHWAVKVVSMNIPADAPPHTGRNQFLEAANQVLYPPKEQPCPAKPGHDTRHADRGGR